MSTRPHLPPSIIAAEDAPAFWRVGILWNVVLSAETTSGELTMMDQTMPEASGAPPHIHERYDEGFFIIDGAIEYTVGSGDDQQTALAEAGAAVWIPRGTRHTFTVRSETSRALNFYTPGGFDESISLWPPRLPPAHCRRPTAASRTPTGSRPTPKSSGSSFRGSPTCTRNRGPDAVARSAQPSYSGS